MVGTERAARGKHPHAAIAAEHGRTHGGRPALRPVEQPQKPQMGEILQAAKRLTLTELLFKHHTRLHPRETALAGNAELALKRTLYVGNDGHRDIKYCLKSAN